MDRAVARGAGGFSATRFWAAGVVWGLWGAMLLGALLFVAGFGANAPWYDEWGMVVFLSGARELDLRWLWSAHNDHRIPLPKLVLLGLYEASGWNFRAAMFANVLLLATAAALLIRAAAAVRGRVALSDALFPLLLLHVGHHQNFLWGWQVTQVIPVFLVLVILAVMVRDGLRPVPARALVCSLAVVALPLSGVPGLAYVPGLAAWLVIVGWLQWGSGARHARLLAVGIWACAALAVLLVPLYFIDLAPTIRATRDLLQVTVTTGLFLTQGLAPAVAGLRPWSFIVILGLGMSGAVALIAALRSQEGRARERAIALGLFLVGLAGLALSVGIGRPGATVFPPRYYLMAAPALAWLYFAWGAFGRGRIAPILRGSLVVLAAMAMVFNTMRGIEAGRARAGAFDAFAQDLQEGLPASRLIARHHRTLLPFPEAGGQYWHRELERSFEVLRAAGIGVFGALAPEAPLREVPIHALATGRTEGAATLWRFHRPENVLGLRLIPARGGEEVLPYTVLDWRSPEEEYDRHRRYHHWWYEGELEARVWIDAQVAELRIRFEEAAEFDLPRILLLLPEE